MADDIEIAISFDGADEAQSGTVALAQAIQALGGHVAALAPKVAAVQTAEERMAAAARAAAAAQQAAATQAIAFGQRLQGVASAVQGLVSQFGGQSRTAGLIGASIQTSVQFAQLGAALGPGGALVGGITGALIPAISELIQMQDAAAESARALAREEEALTERHQRMSAERQAAVRAEVASGHITTLTLEEIRRARELEDETIHDGHETRRQLLIQQQQAEERGTTETAAYRNRIEAIAQWNTQISAAVVHIRALDSAEAQLASGRTVTGGVVPGGGAATPPRTTRTGPSRADRETEQSQFETTWAATLADGEAASDQRRLDAVEEQYEANERLIEAKLRWQQELDEADKAFQQAERERAEEGLEQHMRMQDAALEAERAHTQAVTEQASSAASSLIGAMTDVISQIAEGNATAEEGAQMMLAAFLQALSQRAQIEALAQIAQAISSYPDVAGIAAHIAGALAWGAVAVATGVGGAAISSGVSKAQSARAEAEKPASPRMSGTSEGKGGGTTVVNFNGPVMTAQGNAQLGQLLRGPIAQAERRFPGGF